MRRIVIYISLCELYMHTAHIQCINRTQLMDSFALRTMEEAELLTSYA